MSSTHEYLYCTVSSGRLISAKTRGEVTSWQNVDSKTLYSTPQKRSDNWSDNLLYNTRTMLYCNVMEVREAKRRMPNATRVFRTDPSQRPLPYRWRISATSAYSRFRSRRRCGTLQRVRRTAPPEDERKFDARRAAAAAASDRRCRLTAVCNLLLSAIRSTWRASERHWSKTQNVSSVSSWVRLMLRLLERIRAAERPLWLEDATNFKVDKETLVRFFRLLQLRYFLDWTGCGQYIRVHLRVLG